MVWDRVVDGVEDRMVVGMVGMKREIVVNRGNGVKSDIVSNVKGIGSGRSNDLRGWGEIEGVELVGVV